MSSRVQGAAQLTASLRRAASTAPRQVARVVQHHGMLLQTRVRANASGRPGPRAQTGDYRRSIALTTSTQGDAVSAEVGTNMPQAWRLEAGFTGADSLGRVYEDPPRPHFGPAFSKTSPEFVAGLRDVLRTIIPKGKP